MKEEEIQEFKFQVPCNMSTKRLWRAAFEDAHNCLPMALPHALMRVEYEGDVFQPGSVRTVYYQESLSKRLAKEYGLNRLVKYTKEKILEIDHDSLKITYETVDGGFLGILVTYYNYTIQLVEGSLPDTCIVHLSYQYRPISPKHHPMMCERLKDVLPRSFKGLETYLLANDDYQD